MIINLSKLMDRKLEIEMKETEPELNRLLHQLKNDCQTERVEALYLFKTQQQKPPWLLTHGSSDEKRLSLKTNHKPSSFNSARC